MISPELRAFLADWLAWVERGAPDGEPYSRFCGLCTNCLDNFEDSWIDLIDLLEAEFGDGFEYPFGYEAYRTATVSKGQHENPARLAWVRAKLAEPVA